MAFIPNEEIRQELKNAVEIKKWDEFYLFEQESENLLEYRGEYPALVVELKWNKNVETALQQIKNKNYTEALSDYTGDILLVGINYDKASKKHKCLIESMV